MKIVFAEWLALHIFVLRSGLFSLFWVKLLNLLKYNFYYFTEDRKNGNPTLVLTILQLRRLDKEITWTDQCKRLF